MSVCVLPDMPQACQEAVEVATGGQHPGVTQERLQEPLQLSTSLIIPSAGVHGCAYVCAAVKMEPTSSYRYQARTLPLSHIHSAQQAF